MSLRKSPVLLSRRAALIGAVASAGALAGCTNFQPVYGPNSGLSGSTGVSSDLASLFVETPETRVEQEIYNALLFSFGQNPATGQSSATHLLNLTTSVKTQGTLVARSGEINARNLVLNTTFFMRSTSDEKPLLRGGAKATVPFDSPADQQFADQRAELDAENRAAREVARQITAQVSGYFASRT